MITIHRVRRKGELPVPGKRVNIATRPKWDDDMFDGFGGFVGEDEHTTVMCDAEYDHIVPWPDRTYLVFPHRQCFDSYPAYVWGLIRRAWWRHVESRFRTWADDDGEAIWVAVDAANEWGV